MSDMRFVDETHLLDVDVAALHGQVYLKFDPLFSNNCAAFHSPISFPSTFDFMLYISIYIYIFLLVGKMTKEAVNHFCDNVALMVELIHATLTAR